MTYKKHKPLHNITFIILVIILIIISSMMSSCSIVVNKELTRYQKKNLSTFTKKKRPYNPKKQGSWYHPSVTRESRKILKQQLR